MIAKTCAARFLEPVILAPMPAPAGHYERIYAVVSRIPRGRVATYGQVARLAGLAGQARLVGYALSALDDRSRVPWHRVVNVRGQISSRREQRPGEHRAATPPEARARAFRRPESHSA